MNNNCKGHNKWQHSKEYFEKDQNQSLGIGRDITLSDKDGNLLVSIPTRINANFESNSLYISFYIPHQTKVECPARMVLNSIDEILAWKKDFYVSSGFVGERHTNINEMVLTGRIFILKMKLEKRTRNIF